MLTNWQHSHIDFPTLIVKFTVVGKAKCRPLELAHHELGSMVNQKQYHIKKMWHIYKMEYYSALKRNKIELFVVRWMDLESVIQSEVHQKEKNKYRILTYIYGI